MNIRKGHAAVNDTQLFYEESGDGEPLILIHGFALDHRQWDDQMDIFVKDYRVLRYDLRGFGKSKVPSDIPYSHADDLKALLDHLDIQEAHILGHSFGGRVAITFAIFHPEMTISLIGADPALEGFQPNHPSTQELMNELDNVWSAGRVDKARELFLKFSPIELAMSIPSVAQRIKQMMGDYSGWHWVNEDLYQPMDPPAALQLDKIKSPTLILLGNLNPQLIVLACEYLAENIVNAKLKRIPGVAHMLNMEAPEEFNAELMKFLQSL